MSAVEPRTIVEDWAHLRARHLRGDLAQVRTVLLDRKSLASIVQADEHAVGPVFARPAAPEPRRGGRALRRWPLRALSGRELVGLLLLSAALVAALCWNPKAVDPGLAADAVTFGGPLLADETARNAVVSRLADFHRKREQRLLAVERAVDKLVQEQREGIIADRAKEEALAELRGRSPDSELLARLGEEERAELEGRASSLLASGDREKASMLYRTLEARFPDSTVYKAFVRVLDWQIECSSSPDEAEDPCL